MNVNHLVSDTRKKKQRLNFPDLRINTHSLARGYLSAKPNPYPSSFVIEDEQQEQEAPPSSASSTAACLANAFSIQSLNSAPASLVTMESFIPNRPRSASINYPVYESSSSDDVSSDEEVKDSQFTYRTVLHNHFTYQPQNSSAKALPTQQQKDEEKEYQEEEEEELDNQCARCGKLFNKKSQLKSHSKLHDAKKNFKCPTCGMPFLRKHDLSRHGNFK